MTDMSVVHNSSLLGAGGLFSAGTLTIRNSTVASNGASQSAVGGIGVSGQTHVINSTITENGAGGMPGTGTGGIAGPVTLQNTILAGNTYNFQPADCAGAVSLGNNIIGDLAGCDIDLLPSDRVGNPGLGPYTDDGTPGHGHYPLLSTSQAINAGNPAVCPKTDQLGEKRLGICDIGSIEFQGTVVSRW
jgi:hypothetical protein